MSGGHGHGGGSSHGAAHGHGAGHAAGHGGGHDAHGAAEAHGDHGPAEIPAAPAERWISPARSDFEQPWPGKGLLWPLVWTGVAGVLALLSVTWRGPILQGEHGEHGDHGGAAPHAPGAHEGGATPTHGDAEPTGMGEHGK